jgi:hypothetical protein
MGPLRAVPTGFQQITSLSAATNLTLPVGAQVAQATGATLSGRLLTVGGTVTGVFATGQYVQGTGIPPNTYITGPGSVSGTWNLSNICTTESAETITAFAPVVSDFAIVKALTQNVAWRDDGVAPTATVGMIIQTTDPLFEYYGDLAAIQFIQVTASATLNVSYYRLSG